MIFTSSMSAESAVEDAEHLTPEVPGADETTVVASEAAADTTAAVTDDEPAPTTDAPSDGATGDDEQTGA